MKKPIPIILLFTLTSCSIIPVYKYNVSYKKCESDKTINVTFTGSWLDTEPYYDEWDKILHLMWREAFYHPELTPVWWITNVCSATIASVEQENETLLHPDINANWL